MPKCSFSGKEIPPGTGIMYVKKDGKVLWFADSKNEKNYITLERKPRETRWTEEARAAKRSALATGQKPGEQQSKSAARKAAGKQKQQPARASEGEDE